MLKSKYNQQEVNLFSWNKKSQAKQTIIQTEATQKRKVSDGLVTKLLLHTTWFQRRDKRQYVICCRADWVNMIEQMEKQNLVDNYNIKISITQQIRVGNSRRLDKIKPKTCWFLEAPGMHTCINRTREVEVTASKICRALT